VSLVLETSGLSSGYSEDVLVLHDVAVAARDHQITCVIGANGVGKSTLLKTIFGLLRPAEGKITYDGKDITRRYPYDLIRLGISFVPQLRSVFPYLTVHENLELAGWSYRGEKKRLEDTIGSVYERYPKLETLKRKKAGVLSGGEQRLLEILKSLVTNPKTLLIDEPTAGLAPQLTQSVYEELTKLKEQGITILLVDQNIRDAVALSDYVYVLELGRNKLEGPREQLEGDLEQIVRGMFA
jgi:branched-chain amino acid transport system ATP-binding protein